MRTLTKSKSRRRSPLHVESLEEKALLSGVHPLVQHAHPVAAAVSTFTGSFSGTYYSTNIPFLNNGMRYGFTNHGQINGMGANIYGGISLPNTVTAGKLLGSLVVINRGGTMTINVSETATSSATLPSSFTYRVVVGTGNDRGFQGATGTVTINATPSHTFHYGPVSTSIGQSTIAFV
jgi:hypothetical protein